MPQHPFVAPPAARPPMRSGDVAASTAALAWAGVVLVLGGGFASMSLAFIDGCNPPTCDPDAFSQRIHLTLLSSVLVGLVGTALTVLRLRSRKLAWPWAVLTAVVMTAIYVVSTTLQFTT